MFNIFMAGFFQVLASVQPGVWSDAELAIFADDIRIMSFSTEPEKAAASVNALLRLLSIYGQHTLRSGHVL